MALCERAGLSHHFWPYALAHHVWFHNRTVHPNMKLTPYEMVEGHSPSLAAAKKFGCMALSAMPIESRSEGQPLTKWGIYLGMAVGSKAWTFAASTNSRSPICQATAASFFEEQRYRDFCDLQSARPGTITTLHNKAEKEARDAETAKGALSAGPDKNGEAEEAFNHHVPQFDKKPAHDSPQVVLGAATTAQDIVIPECADCPPLKEAAEALDSGGPRGPRQEGRGASTSTHCSCSF